MRTTPELHVKSLHEIAPGELVFTDVAGKRLPAIAAPFHEAQDGDVVVVLVYLADDVDGVRGPRFGFAEDRLLSVGHEYAVVLDPVASPPPSTFQGAPRLVIMKNERLLCVWANDPRWSLALNLDTGKTQRLPSLHRLHECFGWEVRLKIDSKIDFISPPVFTWNRAAAIVTPDGTPRT
jgi:hypothetical protein